jgi:hypothetical protein
VGLAALLLAVFLRPTIQHHWSFGVGPDVPVYLWWARVGAAQGISVVGERPGIPALLPTLAGTLHLPLVATVAGVQYALAVLVGVTATGLVRGRSEGGRWAWLLVGLFTGLFAVHLGGGYIANLAFTVPFFAAGAALATRSRRGTVAAALLLGGGGLAHPQFFVVGVAVLAVAAVWAWVREPERGWASDAGRVTAAVGGGAALVLAGLTSMLVGPPRLSVDTSKDAFLRRTGLTDSLRRIYLDRFWEKFSGYAPWVLLPLGASGVPRARGFTRRFLVAWAALTIAAVPIGVITSWFPPDRIITFGFALPALAALGIVWLWDVLAVRAGRWLAWPIALLLIGILGQASWIAWTHQDPFVEPPDLAAATLAGRIAASLPPDTPLVFIVNDRDTTATFLATAVANVARAAVPPERAGDVYVYVGDADRYFAGEPTIRGRLEFNTLSRASLAAIPPGPRAVFVAEPYDRVAADRNDPALTRWSDTLSSSVPDARALAPLPDELHPSSPVQISWAALAIGLLLWVIGFGWSRYAFADPVAAAAVAPGFGVAVLAAVSLTLERIGVPLTGSWGPTIASGLSGLLGYGLLVLKGEAVGEPISQVHEGPDQEPRHDRDHDPVAHP